MLFLVSYIPTKINIWSDKVLLYSRHALKSGLLLDFLFCNIWMRQEAACYPGPTTKLLLGMLRIQTDTCAGNVENLFCVRTHGTWLISFDSCFFIPHIIVPVLLCFLHSSLPLLRSLTSFAPLNTAIIRWPGADAVDLYTVSCDWAAPICRSDLKLWYTHYCCFGEASRFGQCTAVQLPEFAFFGRLKGQC